MEDDCWIGDINLSTSSTTVHMYTPPEHSLVTPTHQHRTHPSSPQRDEAYDAHTQRAV